jgi:hypothetical protein
MEKEINVSDRLLAIKGKLAFFGDIFGREQPLSEEGRTGFIGMLMEMEDEILAIHEAVVGREWATLKAV